MKYLERIMTYGFLILFAPIIIGMIIEFLENISKASKKKGNRGGTGAHRKTDEWFD